MTIEQLAQYSSTELEQLNTDDLSRITVKDIFHLLEVIMENMRRPYFKILF